MQRFAVKKWWSVVVSERGPYVSYEEAQAMIDRLRADRDKHRADNKLLWDQIAEQKKTILESRDVIKSMDITYDTEHAKYIELQSKYMTLAKCCNLANSLSILGWGLFAITLIIAAVVLRGGV